VKGVEEGREGNGKEGREGRGPTSKVRGEGREERGGLAPKPKKQTSPTLS